MFRPVEFLKERWKRQKLIKELKQRVKRLIDLGDSCVLSTLDEDCRRDYYLDLGHKTGITRIGGTLRIIHDDAYSCIEVNDEVIFINTQRIDYVLQLLRQKMVLDDLAKI